MILKIYSCRNIKKFATLSPIEEFPYGATLGKYISKPNTITSSILQNGIKLVSRDVSESSVSIQGNLIVI